MAKRKKAVQFGLAAAVTLLIVISFFLFFIPGTKSKAADSDFYIHNGILVRYTGSQSKITIPKEVEVIGAEAFSGNTTLRFVTIGDRVREIKSGAFSNNIFLRRVTIGKGVREIGSGIFAGCTDLVSVVIDPENAWFITAENGLYNTNKSVLYAYFGGAEQEKFILPATVTRIMDYAFWGNEQLKEVVLGSSLREISGYAFSGCKALTKIEIPYSVRSIGPKAFEHCKMLGTVRLSPTVSYIHSTAFDGCSQLEIRADEGTAAADFYEDWKTNDWGMIQEQTALTVVDSISENTVSGGNVSQNGTGQTGGTVYLVGGNHQVTQQKKDPDNVQMNGGQGIQNTEQLRQSAIERAKNHPSNVDAFPLSDPLEMVEDGVIGKTIVVGSQAVILDASLSVNPTKETEIRMEGTTVNP